jgi:2-aminoadipate transaminase
MGVSWERLFEGSRRRLRGSAIRDLLALTAQPDVISFAGGLPAPELFPVEAMRESFDRVLRDQGTAALQYGPSEGYLPLREYLAERLTGRGISVTPDTILITTGSQQALDLLGKVLLQRGSTLMVEAPSYVGALQAFTMHEPEYMPVHMDADGVLVDEARALIEAGHASVDLFYTVATFQNPSGVTMSHERRVAVLELSDRTGMPVVEDDPYGDLRFDGRPVPALRALPGGQDAVYLGTFSKTLAPGLRLGYAVGPRPLISRMVLAKQAADLHTDCLAQYAVLDYCLHNDVDAHIRRLSEVYGARRDAMLSAMQRAFPASCTWTRPAGGLFTWVTLPAGADATALLRASIARKVAFVPGGAFYTDGSGENMLRLNFSHSGPEKIEEGIKRLGEVFYELLPVAAQPATVVA